MAAFVRRALFGAITSIGYAFGGAASIRAQCHTRALPSKKTARLLRAVRWFFLTFNHRLSCATHCGHGP